MIHKNKAQFTDIINMTANRVGFRASLIEKDYYLTVILSKLNELSDDLIFKGGTCLNKIYYLYYRLSQDLDFSMRLPDDSATRGNRRKAMQTIKNKIAAFAEALGMRLEGAESAGRNESKQYIYYFVYDAVMLPVAQSIKLEISLRFNPLIDPESRKIQHLYKHPFTGAPLFDAGCVNCLALDEIVSEKLRAAALRKDIAPRDFYDIDFILRNKFNIKNKQIIDLFRKKLAEDNGDTDLKKYLVNMGRTDKEMKDMRVRIKEELFEVLTGKERDIFNLDKALKRINRAMALMIKDTERTSDL